MNIIKELFSKENRKTTFKVFTYPILWGLIMYGFLYGGFWLGLNVFY